MQYTEFHADNSLEANEIDRSFVVEDVKLNYYYGVYISLDGGYESSLQAEQIVQPVWVFSGHNADRTRRFVAYVQAVREEYVEDIAP